jgi:hypothetical protein
MSSSSRYGRIDPGPEPLFYDELSQEQDGITIATNILSAVQSFSDREDGVVAGTATMAEINSGKNSSLEDQISRIFGLIIYQRLQLYKTGQECNPLRQKHRQLQILADALAEVVAQCSPLKDQIAEAVLANCSEEISLEGVRDGRFDLAERFSAVFRMGLTGTQVRGLEHVQAVRPYKVIEALIGAAIHLWIFQTEL